MDTSNAQNLEEILTPSQFLEWFLLPKTAEGHLIIQNLDKGTIKQALDLKEFFMEGDTRRLFECINPEECLRIIKEIIGRIRSDGSLQGLRSDISEGVQGVLIFDSDPTTHVRIWKIHRLLVEAQEVHCSFSADIQEHLSRIETGNDIEGDSLLDLIEQMERELAEFSRQENIG